MKITFKPLHDPAPVRPADMPEGVAFECYQSGQLVIRMLRGERLYGVADDGYDPFCYGRPCEGRVIRRRDGQPLPNTNPEPVPLDTLEPFPVWYRGRDDEFYAHDTTGGYIEKYDGVPRVDCLADGAGKIKVYPTPHIMQVEP